jgi:hypothetical protein
VWKKYNLSRDFFFLVARIFVSEVLNSYLYFPSPLLGVPIVFGSQRTRSSVAAPRPLQQQHWWWWGWFLIACEGRDCCPYDHNSNNDDDDEARSSARRASGGECDSHFASGHAGWHASVSAHGSAKSSKPLH